MSEIQYKSSFHAEVVKPNMVFLFSERQLKLLRGKMHHLLAPYLRAGKYTADQIVDALDGVASATEIYYALARLEKAQLVEKKEEKFSRAFAVFCQNLGVSPNDAQAALKKSSLFVECIGAQDKKALAKSLKELGIRTSKKQGNAALTLLLVDDYLNIDLILLQKELLQKKVPYLMAKLVGCEIWLGPLFIPEETGCGNCLRRRLKRNRIEESYVQNKKRDETHIPLFIGALESTKNLGLNWLATEIFKILVKAEHAPLKGKILSFDLITSKIEEHHLVKLPQCSLCGSKKSSQESGPLKLESRKKGIYDDNGWRCMAPEATLKKHAHQVGSILGVVKFLQAHERREGSSLYLYLAGHNFALSNEIRGIYRPSFRSSSGGKGRTDTQAKASALSEAIERYSGIFQGDEQCVKGSFLEMKKRGALDLRSCLKFSERQYANRDKTNKTAMGCHFIPAPFDEKTKTDWTPVWSMTEKKIKYLPTAYLYYGYPSSDKTGFCNADSNGNAAGNFLEEAILQGFMELVERDAIAIWWYNRLKKSVVDLHSFKDPYIPELLKEYEEMKREVWVLDLTTDLKIPVFAAISRKIEGESEEIYMGFGAHLNPKIALIRALTEMNQFLGMGRVWEMDAEDEGDAKESQLLRDWFKSATLKNQPYLVGQGSVAAQDFPKLETNDLLDDIHLCQKIVEEKGMEFFVLNQTRPDIDLKVVKVIVPGLRHFWPQFAPGRLYDVPVQMGWLKKPKKEEELNPIPMFL